MPCGFNLEVALEPIRRVLRRSAGDEVSAHDVVRLDVRMLPVLPADGMLALLREQLRAGGYVDAPDGSLRKTVGDIEVRLLPDGSAVELTRAVRREVEVVQTAAVRGSDDEERADAALAKAVRDELERKVAREREQLEQQNLARLAALEPTVRGELQAALNKVYREALEQRARQLGELESLREQGDVKGTYEVTVVVKA